MQIKTNSGTILTLEKDPSNSGYWIINEEFGNSYISELYLKVYMKAANWVIIREESEEEPKQPGMW